MTARNDLFWLVAILIVTAAGIRLGADRGQDRPPPPETILSTTPVRAPVRLYLPPPADSSARRTVYIPLSNVHPRLLARLLRAARPDTEVRVVGNSLKVSASISDLRAIASACRRLDHPLDLAAWNALGEDAQSAACGR